MSKSYYHPFLHCSINVIFVGNSDQEKKKVIQTFQNLKGLQMFARKYGFMSKFEKKTDLMRFL
jgi:hypothetical protein